MYGLLYNYSCVATFIFIVFHIRRKLNFLANSIGKKLLHVFSYHVPICSAPKFCSIHYIIYVHVRMSSLVALLQEKIIISRR